MHLISRIMLDLTKIIQLLWLSWKWNAKSNTKIHGSLAFKMLDSYPAFYSAFSVQKRLFVLAAVFSSEIIHWVLTAATRNDFAFETRGRRVRWSLFCARNTLESWSFLGKKATRISLSALSEKFNFLFAFRICRSRSCESFESTKAFRCSTLVTETSAWRWQHLSPDRLRGISIGFCVRRIIASSGCHYANCRCGAIVDGTI